MGSRTLGFFVLIAIQLMGVAALTSERQNTIRNALEKFGFEPALSIAGGPDLDEPLTSSDFDASDRVFVAAYYFKRELAGQLLGPLHISAFHKNTGRWVHAKKLDASGSVLNVEVMQSHIFVELHHNPSSGASLLLDAETLALRASLKGLGLKPLAGGEVLYSANLRHFAPTHQERLIVYNPRDRTEQELFPGSTQSTVATNYRRLVAETYAALAPEEKKELSSVYGPVEDFDRSIGPVIESKDGRRIAFSVGYESDRLIDTLRGVLAIARCERDTARRWTCSEYALDQAEKLSGMKVRRGADRYYERADVDQVLARIIELR